MIQLVHALRHVGFSVGEAVVLAAVILEIALHRVQLVRMRRDVEQLAGDVAPLKRGHPDLYSKKELRRAAP